VIGNPPYIKNERMTATQRESIARLPPELHSWVKGRPIFGHILLCTRSLLAPGGRMAWVLPGNFLSADYSVKLKAELIKRFKFVTAISVSERLFLNQGTEENRCTFM
jgi:type I restriction-modification system DNA methylase subunit